MRYQPQPVDMFRLGSNHEFDIYFARAALEEIEAAGGDPASADARRGSLPSAPPNRLLILRPSEGPKRASSCKFPSSASRARKKKQKQQEGGDAGSPRRHSSTTSPDVILSPCAQQTAITDMLQSPTDPPPGPSPPDALLKVAPPTPSHQPEPQAVASLDPSLLAPDTGRADFKCHSAPHSRSSSWKKSRRPRSYMEGGPGPTEGRSRTGSVPLEESVSRQLEQLRLLHAEDCCVVRSFTTSSKGLVNRGDSFKRKSFSGASDVGGGSQGSGLGDIEPHSLGGSTAASSTGDETTPQAFRVGLLGAHGVGKSSLVQQFMTSEYMAALDTSFDEQEVTLSVLLDGEETMIELHKLNSPTDTKSGQEFDAYLVVYSITDRQSFLHALDLTNALRRHKPRHPAIILVANKSDLVRSRQVTSEEGREVCLLKDCKYIEVSAALNHKVDDLLVGVVSQIRLHPRKMLDRRRHFLGDSDGDVSCSGGARGLLQKLFKRHHTTSKSCDNLLIL